MKTASSDLIAYLNSGTQYMACDLVTLTAGDGTVYRWTDAECDIISGGQNYCTQSEAADNVAWSKTALTVTTGALDPQGGTAADTLVETGATSAHSIVQNPTVNPVAGTRCVISAYVKASGRSKCQLDGHMGGADGVFTVAKFDLSGTGSVVSVQNAGDSAGIQQVAYGFYRIWVAYTSRGTTSNKSVEVGPNDASGNSSYTGSGAASLIVFGMQFETDRATPGAYQPTTTAGINNRNTFSNTSASGVIFKRSKTKLALGLPVDTMDLTLWIASTTTVGGITLLQAIANGYFDGGYVKVERLFMSSYGDSNLGAMWMFSGRVSEVEPTRFECRLQIKSVLEVLDRPFPRNLYQGGCTNTLFDSGCAVVKATYTTAATTTAGSTKSAVNVTNAQPTGYFDLGTILFTSGQNTGVKRTIASWTTGGVLNLSLPLPFAPLAGDTFQLVPGCNKMYSDTNGCPKFSNTARYRGFPYIPRPETTR